MLKLSRNGIGVLTSQYRSVLKKCALLNMLAAGAFLFASNAVAADYATGADFDRMGNTINYYPDESETETDKDVAFLYGGDPYMTTELFTGIRIIEDEPIYERGGWVNNYGDIYIGEKSDNEGGRIEVSGSIVSGKHNTFDPDGYDSVYPATSGGVITNLSKALYEDPDDPEVMTGMVGSNLTVVGATLQNNSSTEFILAEPFTAYEAVGGAISNLSINPVVLRSSTAGTQTRFINNYVMQFVNAYGGALYNGFGDIDYDKDFEENVTKVGIINSSNTLYKGNHAGNEYLKLDTSGNIVTGDTFDDEVYNKIMEQLRSKSICPPGDDCEQRTLSSLDHNGNATSQYGLSDYAFGGAVYNLGEYNSRNETYTGNYAIGRKAFGGALYNSNFNTRINDGTDEEWAMSQISSFNVSDSIKFESNEVVSYETDGEDAKAHGGAVYNLNKLNFNDGSSVEFTNNVAKSYWESYGGALMNANVKFEGKDYFGEIKTIQNATFTGNKAITIGDEDAARARGGAIYNAGKLVIGDAVFTSNEVGGVGTITNNGGAIYNGANEEVTGGYLEFDNENSSKPIVFEKNKAQTYGGAIFNAGATIRGVISQQMLFEDNEDAYDTLNEMNLDDERETHGGGAIFNAYTAETGDSEIKLLLVESQDKSTAGNLLFKSHGYDNIYNQEDQLVQFGGQNFTASAFNGQATDANHSKVVTNASFLGTGKYELVNTQLELGTTTSGAGYIGYNPTMRLAYNEIFLRGYGIDGSSQMHVTDDGETVDRNSHMYLSSDNDAVIDNDFYLESGAVLRYDDKDEDWVASGDNTYGIAESNGKYVFDADKMLAADEAAGDTVNDYINFSKYFKHDDKKNFYLGQYIDNKGYVVYNDENRADTDIGLAGYLVNRENGVIHSAYDGYITKNIHIGTLDSRGGMITINMNNTDLVSEDNEHVLTPKDKIPSGYEFGYYEGAHYVSEVITIDKAITGDTIVVLYKEAAAENETTAYDSINLDVGQRIYFAQTPGEYGVDESIYSFDVENATNPDYEIKVGYDFNDNGEVSVYDWFLYREYTEPTPPGPTPPGPGPKPDITPDVITLIDLPRSSIEQLRSLRLPLDRTNRGQCNCYSDECDNRFCKFEDGRFRARMWATPFYRNGNFKKPVDTDFNLFGVDFGMDFQPTTKDQIGFFGSYRNGKYKNDGNKDHSDSKMEYYSYDGGDIKLNSWLGGAYYRRYIGDLYLMGAMFGGKVDADVKGKNNIKTSVDGLTVGAQAELGYDIRVTNRSILTPSVRGTYNYIDFDKAKDSVGKEVSFEDIHSFEIEGALKFEYQFNGEHELPTTGYIKPSVIQSLNSGGEVKVDDTVYKKTLDDETIGRVEVGFDAELVRNLSLGVFGNYSFGSDYDAWGVGGNLRIIW